eukprot:g32536.t1
MERALAPPGTRELWYEACAIGHYNKINSSGIPYWFPFILCLEQSTTPGVSTVAQKCAASNGIDWKVIDACAGDTPQYGVDGDGNKLMHSFAQKTNNLDPPHQFTPWVVLNGSPLTQTQLELPLTAIVCKAYAGDKPAGCPSPFRISAMLASEHHDEELQVSKVTED